MDAKTIAMKKDTRFRGFGPKCPLCGQPRSHGLRGNPDKRRTFPCLENPETRERAEARYHEILAQQRIPQGGA